MPKYAVKMATGTGKTWVMHALLLWQMLNARHCLTPAAISKTQFGRYKVTANLFTAASYNEYLHKLLRTITLRFDRVTSHREMPVPNLQINEAQTIAVVDRYIRTRLFGQPFNPFNGSDWKILLSKDAIVTKHIIEEMARAIFNLQNNVMTTDAQVVHTRFSSVAEIKMRETFSVETHKTIYERQGYPSSKGGFEKTFIGLSNLLKKVE